ncbi:MAG: hypothetical protein ACYC23_25030, partial [Limisphaerales bacterium]
MIHFPTDFDRLPAVRRLATEVGEAVALAALWRLYQELALLTEAGAKPGVIDRGDWPVVEGSMNRVAPRPSWEDELIAA